MNYIELEKGKSQINFSSPQKSEIKILTYNLFLRPPLIKTNASDFKNERLSEFLKLISNYDIICLQEVFGTFNYRKEKLIRHAYKNGFLYIESSPDPSFFSPYLIDGGLVILSRFPIVYTKYCVFTHSDFPDSLTNRGVIYVKIQIHDEILHLFTLHTQATYCGSEEWIKRTIMTRLHQLEETSRFIDKMIKLHKKNEELVLCIGDFNVNARSPLYPSDYIKDYSLKECLIITDNKYNEYETLLNLFSCNNQYVIKDLLKYNYGFSPATYGESLIDESGKEIPCEIALTAQIDQHSNHCLDYFILIETKENKRNNILKVNEESIKIEKFQIHGQLFSQLSDHYGISGIIKFNHNIVI